MPSVRIVDSFERELPDIQKDWMTKEVELARSRQHVTDGESSLAVTFLNDSSAITYRKNWGTYDWGMGEGNKGGGEPAVDHYRLLWSDEVRISVFNPGEPTGLFVRTSDWFVKPVERRVALESGMNEVRLSRDELLRDMFRGCYVLHNLEFSVEARKPTTLYFDNFRLIGPGIGKNLMKEARCFSFNAYEYLTRPYFSSVTPAHEYTPQRGYGWTAKFQRSDFNAADGSWRQPDDELLRGYMVFVKPFLVDLPNGKYRLHLVEGHDTYRAAKPGYFDLFIRINGGEPRLLRPGARSLAELAKVEYSDDIDFLPGQDLWDTYGARTCRPLECDFEVTSGQARIELVTDPPGRAGVSFMIIYPVEKARAIEPDIAALWRDIKHRFNTVYPSFTLWMMQDFRLPATHEEYLAPVVRAMKKQKLGITARHQEQGFMCFAREPIDEIYPDTVPSPEECAKPCAAFGAPGETESLTVGVFALRDIKSARLDVGEFVSGKGDRIPPAAVSVRIVSFCPRMNAQQGHGDWAYMVVPWHLVKKASIDIPADTCRRFWISVEIPRDARPGRYAAKATLRGADAKGQTIPLSLEVLPFKLDPLPKDKFFCAAWDVNTLSEPLDVKWRSILGNQAQSARVRAITEELRGAEAARTQADFNLIRACGMNAVNAPKLPQGVDASGLTVVDCSGQQWRSKARAAGFQCIPIDKFSETAVGKAKEEGLKAMFGGFLWSPNMVYQEGGLYRFAAGFLAWRVGADGCVFEPWSSYWGDPYSPFDGHKGENGGFAAPCSANWPESNPTLILEGAREGIKDCRYLCMLQRLVAAKKDTPAGREAQAYLVDLKTRIEPSSRYYFTTTHRTGESWAVKKSSGWKGADFLAERKKIVDLIASLSGIASADRTHD
ncbi:MAG: hypothetical protein ACE15C_21270 [Phycisphaerae bacterium]